jgi:adenylate kinase family enzyme
MRILVTGASGTGTTTLGTALSEHLQIPCFDTDDYYWLPTEPPFQEKRSAEARLALLLQDLAAVPSSVVSGSVRHWGRELEDGFSLIVFLLVETDIRLARLRERETARYGNVDPDFLEWARQYDAGWMEGRSRARDEEWLGGRCSTILRLEGDMAVDERVKRVVAELAKCVT